MMEVRTVGEKLTTYQTQPRQQAYSSSKPPQPPSSSSPPPTALRPPIIRLHCRPNGDPIVQHDRDSGLRLKDYLPTGTSRARFCLGITYDHIDDYLYSIAPARDRLLEKMEEYAETNNVPIIGPLVGRFLYNLAKTSHSKRVLEIGAAIGYSGIWLGRAVASEKGSVTTIELDPRRAELAEKNISEAGLSRTIKVTRGDALEVIPKLKDEYDLIFLDSDKEIYSEAFK